jgi:pimeloyl-ACP methyl ester carboxylesterase
MTRSRMTRTSVVALCVLAMLFAATQAATAQTAPDPTGAQGDFAGLVDIGGRKIYLECSGQGSPTVVLVAGFGSSARYWTDDLRAENPPRTMVFPRIAATTRVCAYDRPGTGAVVGKDEFVSRSDPIPQPTAAEAVVTDLHALLQTAGVPGPYVLAGHSLGGFFSRMYASTYPDEVVGMVLIDAYSEFLEPIIGPKLWPKLVKFNASNGKPVPIPGYGDSEAIPYGSANAHMRQLKATSPLRPMPLAMLTHGKPFVLPKDPALSQGFTSKQIEPVLLKANKAQAKLVPDARFFTAKESGHDIHQDQPALTAEAIQQVVAGVRSPDTWYSLQTCCRT